MREFTARHYTGITQLAKIKGRRWFSLERLTTPMREKNGKPVDALQERHKMSKATSRRSNLLWAKQHQEMRFINRFGVVMGLSHLNCDN